MPELTLTSTYVHSSVNSNTFSMGNPMPESTLSPSKWHWVWPLKRNFKISGPLCIECILSSFFGNTNKSIPLKCTVPTYSVILICIGRFREFSQYLVLFWRIISIVSKYTEIRCLYTDNTHYFRGQIHSPWLGDIVDHIPQSGTMSLASGKLVITRSFLQS